MPEEKDGEMKLYRVTLTCEVFVVAESERGARAIAEQEPDHVDLVLEAGGAEHVMTLAEVPEEWRDSIPYGPQPDDREDTIADLMSA